MGVFSGGGFLWGGSPGVSPGCFLRGGSPGGFWGGACPPTVKINLKSGTEHTLDENIVNL